MHSSFSPLQKPRQNLQNHCQISCVNRNPTPYGLRAGPRAIWFGVETGADTGFFFRRGCTRLLLYFNTNKPHSFFFCRIPIVLENRRSSQGGGGMRTPCTLPLDPLLRNITRRKNGFAQICSRQICSKIEKAEEWIKGKDGRWHICLLIYNPVVFFGMQMWDLPSLPQIYILVFTFVRHICKKQIWNPFFFVQSLVG